MSKQVIHELAIATQQGKLTFPQVVKGLLEVGVESYLVDFAAKQKTHYLTDGTTHTVPMILHPGPIASEFDSAALVAAIRGAAASAAWRRVAGRASPQARSGIGAPSTVPASWPAGSRTTSLYCASCDGTQISSRISVCSVSRVSVIFSLVQALVYALGSVSVMVSSSVS